MAFTYSVMLNISDRRALVVGGGNVAMRKVNRLLEAGAQLTVIAPLFCEDILELEKSGALNCVRRAFSLEDIKEYSPFLVIAATDDPLVNKNIAEFCNEKNILVNTITDPENGNFSVQAEIVRNCYAVSVSTYGQGPGFAKEMRKYIEPLLNEKMDMAVDVYIAARQWLFSISEEPQKRVAMMQRLSLDMICKMIDEGAYNYEMLLERVKKWLSCSLD